ncbi:MAG: hypothetical protein IT347_11555 [Candidatus Eisenbacteria bacterium]|nr:hypothetical protein [Candidatus Eisenbacteria bacterium]
MATEATQEAAKSTSTNSAKRSGRKAAPADARKKPAPKKASRKATAKRARRKQSSAGERQRILATAEREGLTALQVQKRFGVKPVTYYSWRKKVGLKGRRGRKPAKSGRPGAGAGLLRGPDLAGQVRQALRAEIARMLPELIRSEVEGMIGGTGGRRRK